MMPSLRRAAGAWQGLGGGRSFPRAWHLPVGAGGRWGAVGAADRASRGASASASRPLATAARSIVSRGRGRAVQSLPRKLLSLGYLSIRQETEC